MTGSGGYLNSYLKNEFHEDCVVKARALIVKVEQTREDTVQQINSAAASEREKNRHILKHLICAIEYHGRLGLPLRGHRFQETFLI